MSIHLENKIPTDPVTITANGGYSWSLEIKQVGDGYCFTDGWNKVVEDIPLDFGDFLCFRLLDKSTFRMSLYGPDGCEMMLPPKTEQDEDVAGEFEDLVLEDDEKNEEDDDPFFTSVITKTHLKILRFPPEFAESAGIDGDERSMTMKNRDGKEWEMGLRLDMSFKPKRDRLSKGWPDKPKRYYLSKGWPDFRRENELSKGDECVFKFIRSEGKLLLAKPLPPDFVSMHLENNIPTDPVTIYANVGYLWSLEIKQVGNGYCFTNGWNKGTDGCEMMLLPKTEQDVDLVLEDAEKNEEDDDDERSMMMKNLNGKEWDMGLRLDMTFKPKRDRLSKGGWIISRKGE
ncbi:hypothetical protein L1987_38694 [Smallanthus sonchifolius]|uniref:Uncharacterized protein n=1 Tax=Smallanthus sonchifolius TaxID=185202 RepID=A0ACB9HKU0_9ASTR|nr:hypothetical protein L1987_38694 [Smallanthus sonchifolius]